jgi:hypothetical protein
MSSQTALIAAFFGNDAPARIIGELPAPVVTFDGNTHTIAIFRKNGSWLKDFFEKHFLSVCVIHKDELSSLNLSPFERGQVKIADGLVYYLQAHPHDGRSSFIWLESKEEADAVAKAIREAEGG